MKWLKEINFDVEFYIKIHDLKLAKNKYISLFTFKEYQKRNDYKNKSELNKYLTSKK